MKERMIRKERIKKIIGFFTPIEWVLCLGGLAVITVAFLVSADKNVLSYASAIFGITCALLNAKGNVLGQFFAIAFALTYAALSYRNRYYGEMLIYLLLMLPIHLASIVTWLKNLNSKAEHPEVKINSLSRRECLFASIGGVILTFAFYFLLKFLNTDNLILSTVSLLASLGAAYLMMRRCEYFTVCFIINDVILIALWSLKVYADGFAVLPSVLSCAVYLFNDAYGFINWKRIKRRQRVENSDNSL